MNLLYLTHRFLLLSQVTKFYLLDHASSTSSSFWFEVLLYKTKAYEMQNKKLLMF